VLTSEAEGTIRTQRAMLFSQLAILFTWLTGLVIAARGKRGGLRNSFDAFIASIGDPRRIVYVGLGAHVMTFLLAASFRGTEDGKFLREVGYRSGPFLLAFV